MKILLIDDSAFSRNMFKRALGNLYTFAEASDGMQGVELYFLEKPDLVILDLTMPGMSGFEVLSQLMKLDPQAKILIGTSDVQELTQQETESLGAVGFLTKPFTPEKVHEAVKKALEGQEQ